MEKVSTILQKDKTCGCQASGEREEKKKRKKGELIAIKKPSVNGSKKRGQQVYMNYIYI